MEGLDHHYHRYLNSIVLLSAHSYKPLKAHCRPLTNFPPTFLKIKLSYAFFYGRDGSRFPLYQNLIKS